MIYRKRQTYVVDDDDVWAFAGNSHHHNHHNPRNTHSQTRICVAVSTVYAMVGDSRSPRGYSHYRSHSPEEGHSNHGHGRECQCCGHRGRRPSRRGRRNGNDRGVDSSGGRRSRTF